MNDQAAALRRLVDVRQASMGTSPVEVWAFASGSQGDGLSTVVENVKLAVERIDRPVRIMDYRRARLGSELNQLAAGEIVLAVLADNTASRGIWQAADQNLLVTRLEVSHVVAAYARLERLGLPIRSPGVGLVMNQVVRPESVAKLYRNFDASTRQFMQTRCMLAGVIPRTKQMSGMAPAIHLFPESSKAALAIRGMVSDLVQQPVAFAM